jgi:hypothetical protein
MLIKLLKKKYLAFLDCGTTASFINQEKSNELRASCIKFKEHLETLYIKHGQTEVIGSMTLNMTYMKGFLKMKFLVVPTMARPIILGLDFLRDAKVLLDIAGGGWASKKNQTS